MSLSKSDYYGAGKHADYKAIRKLNSNGRVLQQGDYNLLSNTWKTHYRSVLDDLFSREHTDVKGDQYKLKKKLAALGKSALGLETGYYSLEKTSGDYGKKTNCKIPRPRKLQIDTETHLVDFSPKYNSGKHLDLSSIYRYSYNGVNKALPNRTHFDALKEQGRKFRSTHFDLGSNRERLGTETTDSYCECTRSGQKDSISEKGHHDVSSIFRRGDWNVIQPTLAKKSVTTEEYEVTNQFQRSNELKYSFGKSVKKNMQDQPDYTKTHIDIQEGDKSKPRFFRKDYSVTIGGAIQKPRFSKGPPSSMVIQKDGPSCKLSINKEDYASFRDKLRDFDRSAESLQNKIKFAETHIKQVQEMRSSSPQTFLSCARTSYCKPRSDTMLVMRPKDVVPKYQHLESGVETPGPLQASIPKEITTSDSPRENHNSRDRIRKKNEVTHFCVGTDELSRSTEHSVRFSKPLVLDPKVSASNIKTRPTSQLAKTYKQLLKEEENMGRMTNHCKISVTKDDYTPMETRRLTIPQQRLIYQLEKHAPKSMRSHLFHMDNTGSLASRTKLDFIPPFSSKSK